MSAREFCWVVRESSLGTVMAAPVAGTDSIYIRLSDSNSFRMSAAPVFEEIAWGGGLAIVGELVSDHYALKGSLKTKLYPSQATFLLPFLMTRINPGQAAPWTTTEKAGDLASVSIYHAIVRPDGTTRRKRYAGVKAAGGRIDVSRRATAATIELDLQGCRSYGNAMDGSSDPDAVEFPAPAESDYPTGPFTFKQTGGHMTIGGATVTQYDDLSIAIENVLDGRWFEQSFLTVNQFCGRRSTLDADLYYKASPDRRAIHEAIAAQAASIGFHNGVTGQNCTIQFHGKNRITKLDYDLAIDKAYHEKLSLLNAFSAAAGEDCSVSFA